MRDEDCQLGNETVGTQVFFNFCLSSNVHLMKFLTLVQGEACALVCRKFKTSRSLNKRRKIGLHFKFFRFSFLINEFLLLICQLTQE